MTTLVFLSPVFGAGQQLLNNSGVPLAGGKINVYYSGSTSAVNTYSDNAGTTLNPNPLVLDSSGRVPTQIFLPAGISYRFSVTDSNGNAIGYTLDGVSGINDATYPYNYTNEWIQASTPTYVTAATFTVPGDQTLVFQANRALKLIVTAGVVYGYVNQAVYVSGSTTVTVTFGTGALDSGLSQVSYGFVSASPTSLPATIPAQSPSAAPLLSVAIGTGAMTGGVLSGNYNVAVGQNAMNANTTGQQNVALGALSMQNNTTGQQNVAVGYNTLQGNTVGTRNTAVGWGSNNNNLGNSDNTSIGYQALTGSLSSQNVAVGSGAGYNGAAFPYSGTNGIYIGYNAKNSTTNEVNAILIGANGTSNGSNTITLGNSSHTDTFLFGRIKIPQYTTAGAPSYVKGALYFDITLNKLRVGGASAWETVTSV